MPKKRPQVQPVVPEMTLQQYLETALESVYAAQVAVKEAQALLVLNTPSNRTQAAFIASSLSSVHLSIHHLLENVLTNTKSES